MSDTANEEPGQTPATPGAPPAPEPQTTATSQPDVAAQPEKTPVPPTPTLTPDQRDREIERLKGRIGVLTAQKRSIESERDTLKASQSADAGKIQQEILTKATELAKVEAQKIAADDKFNGAIIEAIEVGRKEFGAEKFDKAVQGLRGVLNPSDNVAAQQYLAMLHGVLDSGAPAKLIATLGEDPSEAERIMALPPVKMGMELAKLAAQDVEGVSAAPKPITPISGVGRTHVAISAEDPDRSDNIDTRVWMERRAAHVKQFNDRAGRRVLY